MASKKIGEIIVYWGSMFTGKTKSLIRHLKEAGEGAICFKPMIDTRYGLDIIRSHDGEEFPVTPIKQASEILLLLEPTITTVGIDEASLFYDDPTLVPTVQTLRKMGYKVVITGLDMDRFGRPFGQMPVLAAIADQCYKLRTTCKDCGDASSIQYFKGKEGDYIGGAEKYEPLCWDCYFRKMKNKKPS